MIPDVDLRPKIAVQLLGGLGNQMFQAAAAFALARRLGGHLHFDLSRFRNGGLRGFELAPFGLNATLHPFEANATLFARLRRILRRFSADKHNPDWWHGALYHEPHFQYDPGFDSLREDVMISGYFQSERYFSAYANKIAAIFHPQKLASDEARGSTDALAGDDSVALHIRRGDYASAPTAAAFHGVLGFDYYDRAVAHVLKHVPNARIFVFSDDSKAAEEAATRWTGAQSLRGKSAGDDLYLMSCARHHIIANSSFSWWSAWLDRRAGGMKIAPKQWFAPHVTHDTRDLCPPDWLRL